MRGPPPSFTSFIETYRDIAVSGGLPWVTAIDGAGKITRSQQWDLGDLTGTPKPPAFLLRDFGMDRPTLRVPAEQNGTEYTCSGCSSLSDA